MQRIKLLDSLRGIACLVVVFHHLFSHYNHSFQSLKKHLPKSYDLLSYISDLNVEAVLFFFILSGFSIRLSVEKRPLNNRKGINTYLYKRFKRILPVYYLGLAFTLILGIISSKHSDVEFSFFNLIGNLLFLQTSGSIDEYWFVPYGGNGPLWSLSYEMFYYLFFIIFYNIIQKISPLRNIKIVLVATFIISILGVGTRILYFNPISAFLSYFFIWYAGVFLAELYIKKYFEDRYIFLCFLVAIIFYAFLKFYPSNTLMNILKGGMIFISSYLFFRIKYIRKNKFYRKFEKLLNTFFYKIGLGSYAIYILHFPLLIFLGNYSTDFTITLLILLILIYICIHIEQFLVQQKFSFFKIRYLSETET